MTTLRDQVEAMSPLDVLLYRGDQHPGTLSVVAGLYVLDGDPRPGRVLQSLERATHAFPRLRQRVLVPSLPLVPPHWAADPDFDLADHVRFRSVPSPGSLREVLDVIGPELSSPFDTGRPLWEAVILTGLEAGRSALFFRMSHAITDGMGAMQLFGSLFDATPAARRGRRPAGPEPTRITAAELQVEALRQLPQDAVTTALRWLPGALDAARTAIGEPAGFAASVERYVASLRRVVGLPCPPAPALAARSFARRCGVLVVPLPRLKRAARKLHASVNDLYLAAITSALRRYQEAVGVEPSDVPLAVPVNLRRGDEPAAGNFIGAITIAVPAAEADRDRRLERIRGAMKAGRAEPAVGAHSLMAAFIARVPDTVLERLLAGIPRADVQASNVPGPATRPYFAGRQVLAAYPFGPVPRVGAMIAMLSFAEECFVAVHFDAAAFTDGAAFLDCLRQGFAEVLESGGQRGALAAPVLDGRPDG